MIFYIYVLRSLKDNRRYIGMSKHPDKRLIEHNADYTKSTKGYRPWILIYKEEFILFKKLEIEKYFLNLELAESF